QKPQVSHGNTRAAAELQCDALRRELGKAADHSGKKEARDKATSTSGQRRDEKRHFNSHGERPFSYTVCNKGFITQDQLVDHTRLHTEENTEEQPIVKQSTVRPLKQCPHCEKLFFGSTDLTRHISTHTGERPFRCPVCDRGFIRKDQLVNHKRLHSGEKPFSCTVCDEAFRVSSKLTGHMRRHAEERTSTEARTSTEELNSRSDMNTEEQPIVKQSTVPPLKQCPHCEKQFFGSTDLRDTFQLIQERDLSGVQCVTEVLFAKINSSTTSAFTQERNHSAAQFVTRRFV
uniref:C2H2-type domain-containing protein n=1 Tax=Neogobius melanostomus TaxID=47308 RepID=A0A8C6TW72_9GOBI